MRFSSDIAHKLYSNEKKIKLNRTAKSKAVCDLYAVLSTYTIINLYITISHIILPKSPKSIIYASQEYNTEHSNFFACISNEKK